LVGDIINLPDISNIIRKFWDCYFDVIVKRQNHNGVNMQTEFEDVVIYSQQPCMLSYSIGSTSTPPASFNNASKNVSSVLQKVTLIFDSDLAVPAGSKIIVTQNETVKQYACSGETVIYRFHQEIPLALFKGWA
jgi:hypothetical protein